LRDAEANTLSVIELPQWCIDNAFTGWWFLRTSACSITENLVNVIDTRTSAIVGTISYLTLNYTYTSTDTKVWAHQIELYPFAITGLGAGTIVNANASCSGACTNATTKFPTQTVKLNVDAEGESYFDTTAVAPGAVGAAQTTFTYTMSNATWINPVSVSVSPGLDVRCDNATPGKPTVGCVFSQYKPVFEVSLAGPNPTFAKHLSDAQASGLPGAYPNGAPLERMTDRALSDLNGNRACPDASSGGYPRPSGYSCDEYPFRSTYNGAYTSSPPPAPAALGRTFSWCQITTLPQGVTGAAGWSACMIPAAENSSGGGYLSSFYSSERVIDHDKFYVWVH
jgi:hypothetical protein